MARLALALFALLFGRSSCTADARQPTCAADEASCAPAESTGGESLEGDHVLLQIAEHNHLHMSVQKRRQSMACAMPGCGEEQQVIHHQQETHESGGPRVRVKDRQILVDDKPLHIKGICWSPVRKGKHNQVDFHGFLKSDLRMMKEAGINAVRTYGFDITKDRRVLDALKAAGIWVIPTVYSYGREDPGKVTAKVNAAKDHPAILMWSIANEWNYNGIYVHMSHGDAVKRINQVARLVKQSDPSRPVSSVYGEVPSVDTLRAMPDIDVWGINAYRGISFGNLMEVWAARSSKPMYIGEFGADAFNAKKHAEDQQSQAEATTVLSEEILATSAAQGGVCSGGFLFEFSDEWWKDHKGSVWVHDVGGVAPGGGPYPDRTFNEEWWGLVDVDRHPRKAYYAYMKVANPNFAPAP